MPDKKQPNTSVSMPSVERVQQELASAKSLDDCFAKRGIFARLFADTLEQLLDAQLTGHLAYPPHAPQGRKSANSRTGKRWRNLRTCTGDTSFQVPRDPNRTFHSPLLNPYQSSTNELEDTIIGLYAKAVSRRDSQATLHQL